MFICLNFMIDSHFSTLIENVYMQFPGESITHRVSEFFFLLRTQIGLYELQSRIFEFFIRFYGLYFFSTDDEAI